MMHRLFLCLFFFSFIGRAQLIHAQIVETEDSIQNQSLQDSLTDIGGKKNTSNLIFLDDTELPDTTEIVKKKERTPLTLKIPIFLKPKKKEEPYNPKVAWVRSALIPGWGQLYNRRAWKIPIIYAGLGGLGFGFTKSISKYYFYRNFHKCALYINDNNDSTTFCTITPKMIEDGFDSELEDQYRRDRDSYRRDVDRFAIFTALWYTLNIVDAYVDAHLREFDVSDDLSMKIKPGLNFLPSIGTFSMGLDVSLNFHNRKGRLNQNRFHEK